MAPRKNGQSHRFEQRTQPVDLERRVDEERLSAGNTEPAYEERDGSDKADFDDSELTDEDFAIDGDDVDDDT